MRKNRIIIDNLLLAKPLSTPIALQMVRPIWFVILVRHIVKNALLLI